MANEKKALADLLSQEAIRSLATPSNVRLGEQIVEEGGVELAETGPAFAGGFVLAVSCDMRIVAETAQFSDAHVRQMGIIGNDALNPRLARLVGPAKALEISLTGDPIDGKEAYRIGLANQVYPRDTYLEKAKELARKSAERRPAAVRMAKLANRAGVDMSLREARIAAYFWGEQILDTVEGSKAFLEKRKPKYG